jgi:hypothetical protein
LKDKDFEMKEEISYCEKYRIILGKKIHFQSLGYDIFKISCAG